MPRQPFEIRNPFGRLSIEPVTDFMSVSQICSDHPQAQANAVDLTTAEQVALISGNRDLQVAFAYPFNGRGYVVLHDTPSTAAICRVSVSEFYSDMPPADVLERINRALALG